MKIINERIWSPIFKIRDYVNKVYRQKNESYEKFNRFNRDRIQKLL